jgi:hypothetical protein
LPSRTGSRFSGCRPRRRTGRPTWPLARTSTAICALRIAVRHGETRTRTGDTTIFSRAAVASGTGLFAGIAWLLAVCTASAFSRTLRPFPRRYGGWLGSSAFSVMAMAILTWKGAGMASPLGSGDAKRGRSRSRIGGRLVLVQLRCVQPALAARGSRAATAPSGAIRAPIVSCAISAQSAAALPAWQRRPSSRTGSPSTSRSTVRPPSEATRAATAFASCVSKYASGSASASICARRAYGHGDGPARSWGVAGDLGAVPAGRMDPTRSWAAVARAWQISGRCPPRPVHAQLLTRETRVRTIAGVAPIGHAEQK